MIKIFISYSSSDDQFVDNLAKDLVKYANIFYAKWHIRVGDSIIDKIHEGLSVNDNIIVVLSKASVKSPWVQRELNSSLMRQLSDNSIRILPVLIDDCQIPILLKDIKYADFRNDYQNGFKSLIEVFHDEELNLNPILNIDIEPYKNLINGNKNIDLNGYDIKLIATLVYSFSCLRFGCVETLSKIRDTNEIVYNIPDEPNLADEQLIELIEKGVLLKFKQNNQDYLKLSEIGKVFYNVIIEGLNEGILGVVCSS
jgi:hypothetical protein